jgi:formate hydrogenlyase subunit 6/NADH:ubiquinone oxidoreductase subunit I
VGAGPQTSELYGKFTWKVEKFGEAGGKRELRSNVFEVGTFKWCVFCFCCMHACVYGAVVMLAVSQQQQWCAQVTAGIST